MKGLPRVLRYLNIANEFVRLDDFFLYFVHIRLFVYKENVLKPFYGTDLNATRSHCVSDGLMVGIIFSQGLVYYYMQ